MAYFTRFVSTARNTILLYMYVFILWGDLQVYMTWNIYFIVVMIAFINIIIYLLLVLFYQLMTFKLDGFDYIT